MKKGNDGSRQREKRPMHTHSAYVSKVPYRQLMRFDTLLLWIRNSLLLVDQVERKWRLNTEKPYQEAQNCTTDSYEEISCVRRIDTRLASGSHLRGRTDGIFEASYCSTAGPTGFVLQRERIRYWSLRDICNRDERRGNQANRV
jgi:hypothetical protein